MTTTTWMLAPAGVLGRGIADVRPYPGVVVCPPVEPAPGTGRPIGGFTAEVRGTTRDRVARLRPLTAVAVLDRTADISIAQQSIQNDDTPLGIHTPGRPQS